MKSNPATDVPPERLGPYRIERQIGLGGMGAVFQARDERLLRSVALKRIRRSAPGTSARQQLAHEAQAIAQLSHPNIVQVYDVLEHQGCDWIVMELVDGLTLRQTLKSRALEIDEVVDYCQGIAKGLAAAHARGIVHRDLKTENVMVASDGAIKILDFGLATVRMSGNEGPDAPRVQGTPRAMAPEQAMGQATDHRSDLFSLGVLLYECLSGKSPFTDGKNTSVYRTLLRVCSYDPPPLNEIQPAVSPELAGLVQALLEKSPQNRPESAEDVLLALGRARGAAPSNIRVLFVDDEPDFELLLRQWLQSQAGGQRFELFFAQNGLEALEALRSDSGLQLVFTDLRMPKMDGIQLLREISKLERVCTTVVVSAFGDMANIRSAMNLGAFDFVTKPLDFEDLEATLEKASRQIAAVRESIRLRAENQLLDERNKAFRLAFNQYLQGDPDFGRIFEPLIEQVRSTRDRNLTLLSLEIDGFADLPAHIPAPRLLTLASGFVSELVTLVQSHRGEILSFDQGRLAIGFGFVASQQADGDRAERCAHALRRLIESLSASSQESGGPRLTGKCVVDVGGVEIDGPSGTLSGDGLARADRFLESCSADEILVINTIQNPSLTQQAPPERSF